MPTLFSGGTYEIEAVAADHFTLVCRLFRKACLGAGHWIVRERHCEKLFSAVGASRLCKVWILLDCNGFDRIGFTK
jgi:hypothetical protein